MNLLKLLALMVGTTFAAVFVIFAALAAVTYLLKGLCSLL
jgi:hypothetical protein